MKKIAVLLVILLFVATSCGGGGGKKKSGNVETTKLPNVKNLTITVPPEGNKLKLSWQMPDNSNVIGVLIVRKKNSQPENKDDGNKVFKGKATSFEDTGLTNGTKYFYAIYTYDDDGNYSTGVTAVGIPEDTVPPPQVSNLQVTVLPQGGSLELTWQNPDVSDFQGVVIVRKTGSAPTSVDDGSEVYRGAAEKYIDTGLENGTMYFYAVFSYDRSGNYSQGVVTAGTPEDLPPPPVTDFTAVHNPVGHIIDLSWRNPDVVDFSKVKILRRIDKSPDSCDDNDSVEVYSGTSTTYTDNDLKDNVLYCYGICAVDQGGNYSKMVTACDTAKDEVPPPQVYNVKVTVVAVGNALKISWSEPSDNEYKGVVVIRGKDYCPQTTTDTYAGVVTIGVFQRGEAYFEDKALENDVEYCYSFFSFDDEGNYSAPYQQKAAPHDSVPPAGPTFAKSVPSVFGNIIAWGMSVTDDVRGYRIVRKIGSYPTGATDENAVVVFEGTPQKEGDAYIYTDRTAPKDAISYYAIYAYDESPNYSTPGRARSGMILRGVKGMGVSGFYNELVKYGNGFALFYTNYEEREGLSVKYNYGSVNFNQTSYATVVSSPVSDFKVVPDGNGGYYVVVSTVWENPGIQIYDFDKTGKVNYITQVTSVVPSLEGNRFVDYWALSSIKDANGNIRIYYFEKVTANPTLTEAIFSPSSKSIVYNRDITAAPDNLIPFAINGVAGRNNSIAHLVLYYLNFDAAESEIVKVDETTDSWKFTTVDSTLTNGGYFVGVPAINVDASDKVYIYYKKYLGTYYSANKFKGILKTYYGTSNTGLTRTFGTEYSFSRILLNESKVLTSNAGKWEILTYQLNLQSWPGTFNLNAIYIDSTNPVTVTVDHVNDISSSSRDFPTIGRLRTSGFIADSGEIYLSGWMLDLKGYNGVAFSANSFGSTIVVDNPDTHWELMPYQDTAYNLINAGGEDYIAGTGYNFTDSDPYNYLVMTTGTVSMIDNNASLLDTFYINGTFYSVGRSGNDLMLWVGDPVNGFTPHTVASGVQPANASVYVAENGDIGVAYTRNTDIYFCLSQDSGSSFSCFTVASGSVQKRWVDIIAFLSKWYITYVDSNGLHLVAINGSSIESDSIVNVSGTAPVFKATDVGFSLIYYDTNMGYFRERDEYSVGFREEYFIPCDNSPEFSRVRAPTLIFTPNSSGGNDRSILYQGDGDILYLGIQVTVNGSTCWYYDVPISLFSDDGDYIMRERLGYGVAQDYLRVGYPGGILLRNVGSAFVQDVIFTR